MMDAGIAAAVIGTLAAAGYDLRYHKIPNAIPASMLLLSIPLALLGGYLFPWLENIILASIIFYVFWMLRVWAAGDSKLLIGIAALIPQYPTTFLPQPPYGGFFFLSVVFNLLVVYLLHTIFLILRKSHKLGSFALFCGLLFFLSAAAYVLGIVIIIPVLFSFLVFRIYSEASKLDLTRFVPVSELEFGDNLAEMIVERDGRIVREKEVPASLSSLFGRLVREDASAPTPYGVTEEEKNRLLGLVGEGKIECGIRIYRGTIMSPMILGSLIVSVSLGDVLAAMI